MKYNKKYNKKHKKQATMIPSIVGIIVVIVVIGICTVVANATNVTITAETSSTVVPTTVAPTTVEPTTVEPTTVTPTTVEPTTVEPTTVKPTEEPTTAPVTEPTTGLIPIDNPDYNYQGISISLTSSDREVLRHVIMGEAGGEGFAGAALLAQTIRDNWIRGGYSSAEAVRTGCGYCGWNSGSNSDVEAAIEYIFDQGQNAVQHRVCFMYNPSMCSSSWHESQNYVVTYGPVRYFDAW